MRVIFSSILIILASSTLGKEATLEQHLKDDTELSQVSGLAEAADYTTRPSSAKAKVAFGYVLLSTYIVIARPRLCNSSCANRNGKFTTIGRRRVYSIFYLTK